MTKAAYLKNRDLWIRMLVDDLDLSHATVRVGLHLAMRINADDKAAWPSTATIAKLTGVSVRSVISALQAWKMLDICSAPESETSEIDIGFASNGMNKCNHCSYISATIAYE